MEKKSEEFAWTISLCSSSSSEKRFTTTEKPSKVIPNCNISIDIVYTYNHYQFNVEISVKKTYFEPSCVDMIIQLGNVKKEMHLVQWEDSYTFQRFLVEIDRHEVTCIITWFTPELIKFPPLLNVNEIIKTFLMSPVFSDVSIVIGEEELPAHKLILSACSTVFSKMLQAPMKEATENRIIINDIDIDVMKMVLTFMYTGEHEAFNEVEMALNGLTVSEKYGISDLKAICEYKLYKNLNIENVLMIVDYADNYRAEKLLNVCLDFIKDHKAKVIVIPEFKILCSAKPDLMFQFFIKFIANI